MFKKLILPGWILTLLFSSAASRNITTIKNKDDFLNGPPLIVENFDVLPLEENRSRYLTFYIRSFLTAPKAGVSLSYYTNDPKDPPNYRKLVGVYEQEVTQDEVYYFSFLLAPNTVKAETSFVLQLYNKVKPEIVRVFLFDLYPIDTKTYTIEENITIAPKGYRPRTNSTGYLTYHHELITVLGVSKQYVVPIYRYFDWPNLKIYCNSDEKYLSNLEVNLYLHNMRPLFPNLPTSGSDVKIPMKFMIQANELINVKPKAMYLNPLTWSSRLSPDKSHTVPTDKIYFPKNTFSEGKTINATLRVNNLGYNKTNLIIKSQFVFDKTLVGNKMTGYFYVETSSRPVPEIGTSWEEVIIDA